MSAVVSMLKEQTVVPEVLILDPNAYSDNLKFNALRGQYDQILVESCSDIEPLDKSLVYGSSFSSAQDLY